MDSFIFLLWLCRSLLTYSCAKSKRTWLICSVNTDKTNTADVQVSQRVLWARNLNLKIWNNKMVHEMLPMVDWRMIVFSNKWSTVAIHILADLLWIWVVVLMEEVFGSFVDSQLGSQGELLWSQPPHLHSPKSHLGSIQHK